MSFYKNKFTRLKITGLTAGQWTAVNISTLVAQWNTANPGAVITYPAGTKAVHLKFDSVALLSTTYGARKLGSTDGFTNSSNARVKNDKWIELSSNQIELFVGSNANGEWYLEGFDSHLTFLETAVEKGGSVGSGTVTLDYSSELPADAAGGSILMELSRGVRIGAYGNVPLVAFNPLARTHVWIPLDALRRCQYISGGGTTANADLRVIAWAKAGAIIHSTAYLARTVASINTWLPLPDASTETVLGMYRMYNASDNIYWGMRASDNTTDNDVDTSLLTRYTYAKHGVDGITHVNVSNIGIQFYYMGGIVETLAPANIVSINQLIAGQPFTATTSNTTFLPTTFSISDGGVTKTIPATFVSAGVYSAVCPTWVDGETVLKFGTVNVTANDGSESTPIFPKILAPWAGYAPQDIDSLSTDNYGAIAGYVPGLKIGSQSVYKPADGFIYTDASYDDISSTVATTNIWDRDPDTFLARSGVFNFTDLNVDTEPAVDTFGVVNNVQLNTLINAPKSITILDVAAATNIPVVASNGIEYRVNSGSGFGPWKTANDNVQLNYIIESRMISPNAYNTPKIGTLTVGGIPFTLTLTTRAINSIPNAVIVTWPADGVYISNPFTIDGVDVGANVSVVVGTAVNCAVQYQINELGFTSANGVAHLNDAIKIKLTVTDPDAITPNATLIIGGVPLVFYAPVNSKVSSTKQNNFVASFM